MAIEFSGDYVISAPRQRVWEALNDPEVLQACIAGCRSLERVSAHEFKAIVAARVGPVSTTFRGNVILSDLNPPQGYTLTGQGQGGAAGFAKMSAKVSLRDDAGQTHLSYIASAEIGGKLAAVGSRLMQSVAKKNADDFFLAFSQRLGGSMAPLSRQAAAQQPDLAAASPAPASGATVGAPATPARSGSLLGSLAAPVPAWLVLFTCAIGFALGYLIAR